MSPRFRPPERRFARPIGVLAIALGISLIVFATFSSRPGEETDDDLGQAATATSETVLGEVIERTTLPDAAPAEPAGFTTTTGTGASDEDPTVNPGTVPDTTGSSPTTRPPVPTTRPSATTTTVRPTTSTTSTTAPPTTTTEPPTTTTTETTTTIPPP